MQDIITIGANHGSHARMNTVTLACLQIQHTPGHLYDEKARYTHERIRCKTTS